MTKPEDSAANQGARDQSRDGSRSGIATEWFWETDSRHRFTYVSSQTSVATGLNMSEIIGGKREDFAADRDDPKWARHLADLEEHRPFWRFEYAVSLPDKPPVHVSVSGEPRFDENGQFLGYRGAASDITGRREIERELREARDLFRAVLEHAPFGIVLKDRDGRYLEVSREWQRRFGATRDQVVGKTPSEFLPADIAKAYEARDSLVLKQGHKDVREERLGRPDGSSEYFLTASFPTLDRDGNVSGLGLISTDITDRKLAELALEEGEQQLRTITDNLPVLIARHDRDWRYRFINREGASWYGMPPSRIVGKALSDILSAEACEAVRPMIDAVLSGETARYSGSIDYLDGKTRNVLINYVPDRAADGSIQGWFALAQDMTEREQAAQALSEREAQMRTITDNLPVFIAYLDSDQRYRFVNSTVEKWYGRAGRDIIGRKISDIIMPETYRRLLPRMEAVLSGQEVIFEDSLQYPDGVTRAVEMTWIPDLGEDGQARGWFGLIHDITERKRLEAELLNRERLAVMGQLTGTVAHELRNPLGAVATSITALRRRSAESGLDLERALSRAERGISRCDRIITELLDFARAKGMQREPTRFGEWLVAVIAEQDIPDGISLSLDAAGGNVDVMIDREDFRRAIINVLDNACQAVAGIPGGGHIVVSFDIRDGRLECDLRDNGPGIPTDRLDRVTEPLFSTKSFGTGLGLPTVQRIAEGHGGGIEIESNPGHGTLVRIWLPLDIVPAAGGQ